MDFIITILILSFPILLAFSGISLLINYINKFNRFTTAEGIIIDVKLVSRKSLHPIVEYIDANGAKHVFESTAYTPNWNEVGKKVKVLYNPNDFSDAIIKSWEIFMLPIGLIILGIPASVIMFIKIFV